LKVKYDESLSILLQFCFNFAFNFNLGRYNKGTPWATCLPGTGTAPGEVCDRGVNSATSTDRQEGSITNDMITVCGGGVRFATTHPALGGSHLAQVCGFDVNTVGSFQAGGY